MMKLIKFYNFTSKDFGKGSNTYWWPEVNVSQCGSTSGVKPVFIVRSQFIEFTIFYQVNPFWGLQFTTPMEIWKFSVKNRLQLKMFKVYFFRNAENEATNLCWSTSFNVIDDMICNKKVERNNQTVWHQLKYFHETCYWGYVKR